MGWCVMSVQDEWEQIKRDGELSKLIAWDKRDDAAFWERRRQVKARGYPRGWTENEPEPVWVPESKRVVIVSRVEESDVSDVQE